MANTPIKKEDTWAVSVHTNQFVSQVMYRTSMLTSSQDPKHIDEILKLMCQYKKNIKKFK